MKKKTFIALNGSIIGVLSLAFIAANVTIGVLFDWLTMYTNDMGVKVDTPEAEVAQAESKVFTKEITKEGMTLLRNERGTLPLAKASKINLFGWSSTALITGGSGGSGGGASAAVDIKTALTDAGFSVNQELYDMYTAYQAQRVTTSEAEYGGYSPSWGTPEPAIGDKKYYTDTLLANAKAYSGTAILTLGRSSGEGLDLPAGYLALTQEEKDLAKYLVDNYEHVIVLLNSNAVMELKYLQDIDVEAIIYMPGPGANGCDSLGTLLNGTDTFSGHTVDTWAFDAKSSPAYYYANRPGTMVYSDYQNQAENKNKYYYVDYVEGIYVGYKYYETAAAEGYIDYDKTVMYPFGYGLSYTSFSEKVSSVEGDLSSDAITVKVDVTNTGNTYSGKDVVEIYATAPYTKGGIEKASVDLVGFAKTSLLAPGASETVSISVDPYEIASYDWNDANKDGKTGYVLEKGKYQLKLMEDSHNLVSVAKEYDLANPIYFTKDPTTGAEIKNLFDDVAGQEETEKVKYLSRGDFSSTFPAAKTSNVGRKASAAVIASQTIKWEDDPAAKPITTGAQNGLTVKDVAGTDYTNSTFAEKWNKLLDQMSLDDMTNLITKSMYSTVAVDSIGLAATTHSEGPQGVSAWIAHISGTNYPCETYIALTWNKDIAEKQGKLFAEEAHASNVFAMYAPATNIHRTPYCGRNFEYYSEDGFLAGNMAASVVYSARENGLVVFVKHFALNDQETHRGEYFTSLYTWSNEQAMREVFLKPFEIAVKKGRTLGLMTSFNRIGSKWAGSSHALCTDLLRTEWGFKGCVITDLYMSTNNEWWMSAEQGLRAGQDMWLSLLMFGGEAISIDTSNATTQNAMRNACQHILYMLTQSAFSPKAAQPNWFYHIALPIDIVAGVLLLGYIAYYVVVIVKKSKPDPVN